jgi:hypothetical protein
MNNARGWKIIIKIKIKMYEFNIEKEVWYKVELEEYI